MSWIQIVRERERLARLDRERVARETEALGRAVRACAGKPWPVATIRIEKRNPARERGRG